MTTSTVTFPPPTVDADGLPDLAALAPMDVGGRADRLRAQLAARRTDGGRATALLVTSLTNIRYLTGFSGSAARLLVTDDALLFVTDGRYASQAPDQLRAAGVDAHIEIQATAAAQDAALAAAIGGAGVSTLGLEADHCTWAEARAYADTFDGVELEPLQGLVEALRIAKDPGEVARIEAAAMIADAALASVRHRLLERPTERAFALELDTAIRRFGASGNSFPTIVGSGPNGALPHMSPTDRVIDDGDLVVIDFGALVDGYCSDMTRTLCVGEPDATSARMLSVVLEAQAAGVARAAAGVPATEIDAACREIIAEAGWADAFIHGTGHGVGLDIHEAPRVAGTSDAVVAVGEIITVEPGVYLPGHGGVRIEDTLVVLDDGARALTHTDKRTAP
ncbi:MAG: aminopeptidase P family protein [Acidimicrobiales bacterium]|nr:aminopeptidase P family protein [Acidimicrobiales bacterium]